MEVENINLLTNLIKDIEFLDNNIIFNKKYGDFLALNKSSYDLMKLINDHHQSSCDKSQELSKRFDNKIHKQISFLIIEFRKYAIL